MGIYAGLGIAQAVATFTMGTTFALLTYFASQRLHKVCTFILYLFRNLPDFVLVGYPARHARANVVFRNHAVGAYHE